MPMVRVDRRIIGASIGNFAEAYDFFLYGISAPVLATHFFPGSSPAAAVLGSLAVYAVAFVVRPLGGVIFGFLADRRGRVVVLTLTVLLIGVSTLLTGLLPTYASIGLAAPTLLVLCRVLQGVSMGGETSGSYSYIVESAPEGKRATWVASVACWSIVPAAFAGVFILALRTGLGEHSYLGWAWRIPFVVGGLLAVIGFWLRRRLDDAQEFKDAVAEDPIENPLRTVFKYHGRAIVTVILLLSIQAVTFNMVLGYMSTYLAKDSSISPGLAVLSNTVAIVMLGLLLPVFGVITDRVGRKPVLIAGATWLILLSFPAFELIASGTTIGAFAGQLIIVVGATITASSSYVVVLELFPTSVRGTGHAFSYNVGNAVFGGTAPLFAALLITGTGISAAPAFLIIAVALLGLVVTIFTPETRNVQLRSAAERVAGEQGIHREGVTAIESV